MRSCCPTGLLSPSLSRMNAIFGSSLEGVMLVIEAKLDTWICPPVVLKSVSCSAGPGLFRSIRNSWSIDSLPTTRARKQA